MIGSTRGFLHTRAPGRFARAGAKLSKLGEPMSKLQDLEISDPAKAKQVLTAIASALTEKAHSSTGSTVPAPAILTARSSLTSSPRQPAQASWRQPGTSLALTRIVRRGMLAR